MGATFNKKTQSWDNLSTSGGGSGFTASSDDSNNNDSKPKTSSSSRGSSSKKTIPTFVSLGNQQSSQTPITPQYVTTQEGVKTEEELSRSPFVNTFSSGQKQSSYNGSSSSSGSNTSNQQSQSINTPQYVTTKDGVKTESELRRTPFERSFSNSRGVSSPDNLVQTRRDTVQPMIGPIQKESVISSNVEERKPILFQSNFNDQKKQEVNDKIYGVNNKSEISKEVFPRSQIDSTSLIIGDEQLKEEQNRRNLKMNGDDILKLLEQGVSVPEIITMNIPESVDRVETASEDKSFFKRFGSTTSLIFSKREKLNQEQEKFNEKLKSAINIYNEKQNNNLENTQNDIINFNIKTLDFEKKIEDYNKNVKELYDSNSPYINEYLNIERENLINEQNKLENERVNIEKDIKNTQKDSLTGSKLKILVENTDNIVTKTKPFEESRKQLTDIQRDKGLPTYYGAKVLKTAFTGGDILANVVRLPVRMGETLKQSDEEDGRLKTFLKYSIPIVGQTK